MTSSSGSGAGVEAGLGSGARVEAGLGSSEAQAAMTIRTGKVSVTNDRLAMVRFIYFGSYLSICWVVIETGELPELPTD
tara:strand:+ start:22 stop:258 length:237 start_codon:yes stop_codon:yes gene_type:complete